MDKLKEFLSGKPWYIKLIVLILAGVFIYFSTGCAYKMHVDHLNADNLTREIKLEVLK